MLQFVKGMRNQNNYSDTGTFEAAEENYEDEWYSYWDMYITFFLTSVGLQLHF